MKDFQWRKHETKVYAVLNDDKTVRYMVRLDCSADGKLYRPGTNDEMLTMYIRDRFRWASLPEAQKCLDRLAKEFQLELIKEREDVNES